MKTTFTKWNKMGDHALVKEIANKEFEYQERKSEGCGIIGNTIVPPKSYIVEVNGVFVGVVSDSTANIIFEKN